VEKETYIYSVQSDGRKQAAKKSTKEACIAEKYLRRAAAVSSVVQYFGRLVLGWVGVVTGELLAVTEIAWKLEP
jgi:hypothetical protein